MSQHSYRRIIPGDRVQGFTPGPIYGMGSLRGSSIQFHDLLRLHLPAITCLRLPTNRHRSPTFVVVTLAGAFCSGVSPLFCVLLMITRRSLFVVHSKGEGVYCSHCTTQANPFPHLQPPPPHRGHFIAMQNAAKWRQNSTLLLPSILILVAFFTECCNACNAKNWHSASTSTPRNPSN